jgi:tRNA pseudouridine55 synthase
MSSAEVVRVVKKTLTVEKIGHLGTLDPFASGLLPLCLGTGTKIAQFLMAESKAYTGTIRLGIETDTLDATGKVTRLAPLPAYGPETLQGLERRFSGEYWQTPPMYSALKRKGVPLYKLARRGELVEREPRKITIEAFSLRREGEDVLSFSLSCSKGTYVRSLAADLGAVLGCGAHLATLRRTAFGPFSLTEAIPLTAVTEQHPEEKLPILSLPQALRHYQTIRVSLQLATKLRHGQQEVLRDLPIIQDHQKIIPLLDASDELVAIVEHDQGRWRLARVL